MALLYDERECRQWPPLTPERQALVTDNRGLAWKLIGGRYRWVVQAYGWEEAEGWAMFFLSQAAQRFDFSRGNRFSTFVYAHFRIGFARLNSERWALKRRALLLEVPLANPREEGSGDDRFTPHWLHAPVRDEDVGPDLQYVAGLMRELDARAQRMLKMRYGLDGQPPQTMQDIADQVGLSKECVRQVLGKAVRKLRDLAGVAA